MGDAPGPHPCAVPWPCTTARAQVPRDCLFELARRPLQRLSSAQQRRPGHEFHVQRRTTCLACMHRRACTCHDARAREGQAWAGALGGRRWLPNSRHAPCQLPERAWAGPLPCGSPAHMRWLLAAGHHDTTS